MVFDSGWRVNTYTALGAEEASLNFDVGDLRVTLRLADHFSAGGNRDIRSADSTRMLHPRFQRGSKETLNLLL